jgi:NAD-dependent dihydropyrimidine dehydrogenase PreA subunit
VDELADKPTRVLYCHCAYFDVVPIDTRLRVLAALQGSGVALTAVKDLCALAADEDPLLKKLTRAGDMTVVACYPRAVRALFDAAGAPLESQRATLLNMRVQSPEQILGALGLPEADGSADVSALKPVGSWLPWFPVIDAERCVNCKQCLNFCLFGVYAADPAGRVRVENPDQCKTNCPACARLCPSVAIIFPKYKSGPICGDDPADAESAGERVGVDVSELVAGDVRQLLHDGSARAQAAGMEMGPQAVEQIRARLAASGGDDKGACGCDCPGCSEKA